METNTGVRDGGWCVEAEVRPACQRESVSVGGGGCHGRWRLLCLLCFLPATVHPALQSLGTDIGAAGSRPV